MGKSVVSATFLALGRDPRQVKGKTIKSLGESRSFHLLYRQESGRQMPPLTSHAREAR